MNPWYVEPSVSRHLEKNLGGASEFNDITRAFLTDGYVVIKQGVPDDTVTACLLEYDRFKSAAKSFANMSEDNMYRRIVNLHSLLPTLGSLFAENSALPMCDFLFDSETVLYTSLFYEQGSGQDLHRDTPYFWTSPPYRYFGLWVALEDVDGENGCLEVVPGSHRIPEEDREKIASKYYKSPSEIPASDTRLWMDYQGSVMKRCEESGLKKREVWANRGDVICWHPQTMHGGKAIVDRTRSRESLVMHVTPVGQSVYHHDAFFNLKKITHDKQMFRYEQIRERRVTNYENISFEHLTDVPVETLRSILNLRSK